MQCHDVRVGRSVIQGCVLLLFVITLNWLSWELQ